MPIPPISERDDRTGIEKSFSNDAVILRTEMPSSFVGFQNSLVVCELIIESQLVTPQST
jgi:hypothetical protein